MQAARLRVSTGPLIRDDTPCNLVHNLNWTALSSARLQGKKGGDVTVRMPVTWPLASTLCVQPISINH